MHLAEKELIAVSNNTWLANVWNSEGNSVSDATDAATSNGTRPPLRRLPVASQLALNPDDLLSSAIVDSKTGRVGIKHGQLLGAIDAYDSAHLIHTLPMLPEFSGCPIFKNGYVVAVHVGALPYFPEISLNVLQQCIWAETVLECLKLAGEADTVKRLTETQLEPIVTSALPTIETSLSKNVTEVDQVGCVEVATIGCPRCGANSFHSARSCENCNYDLILPEMPKNQMERRWLKVGTLATLATCAALYVMTMALPGPNLAQSEFVYLPERPWFVLSLKQANPRTGTWDIEPPDRVFRHGDTIHLSINVLRPSYFYLLHQTNSGVAKLIYPNSNQPESECPAGKTITVPETTERDVGGKHYLYGMTFEDAPGMETIVCLASREPLGRPALQASATKIMTRAADICNWRRSFSAFEMPESSLEGQRKNVRQEAAENKWPDIGNVFVTRCQIAHQK